MSDNIPFEIKAEIFKRLPIISLIQIRSVCKAWKFLIDSDDFIKNYSGQMQYLLARTLDSLEVLNQTSLQRTKTNTMHGSMADTDFFTRTLTQEGLSCLILCILSFLTLKGLKMCKHVLRLFDVIENQLLSSPPSFWSIILFVIDGKFLI
ncbi:putative F-box domain-containing protein [Helianthus debilis subsp. tardiflorus]